MTWTQQYGTFCYNTVEVENWHDRPSADNNTEFINYALLVYWVNTMNPKFGKGRDFFAALCIATTNLSKLKA